MVDRSHEHRTVHIDSKTAKILRNLGKILLAVLTVITVVLFWTVRYLMDNWAELSADEIIYHLKSTLDGTNPEMIRNAVVRYAIPAALILIAIAVILYRIRRNEKVKKIFVAVLLVADLAVLLALKTELDQKIGFTQYVVAHFGGGSDFIGVHYVDPKEVEITTPEKKRNLIYIFMESGEVTYADKENGGAFEKNVIPELTELAQENECFSGTESAINGATSLPGTNWTIGAMFAQTTGLPLKVAISGNGVNSPENFFPSIASLGTILESEGYRQELLIGSAAGFGGRDVYFTGHGNYEINDYKYALKTGRIPEDYEVFWGYEDEKLFQFAKEDLTKLAEGEEPFNLTLLTVDTHFEDGYRCRLCRDEFGEQYADVFACSSRQITEFVRWIQDQDFYEDTTVIICGDHPTMDKDFCENVPDDYSRRTYVSVINADPETAADGTDTWRYYNTFDMFPTTLAALGYKIEGDRLGLGVNLYSDQPTIIEEFGMDECNLELAKPSKFMEKRSGIKIDKALMKKAADTCKIKVLEPDENGNTIFSLCYLSKVFGSAAIDEVVAEVEDKETGEVTTYDAEIYQIGVITYYCRAYVPLGDKTADDVNVTFYVSAGKFKHYKVADLENDRLEE